MGKQKREVPELNSSSTADIAFLLLVFFLMTTSMAVNKGLARRLPPPVPAELKTEDLKVKERNVFVVLINSEDQLLVRGEYTELANLKDKAKEKYDKIEALNKHKELLIEKRKRIDGLVTLIDKTIKGDNNMSFKEFDNSKIEENKRIFTI